MAKQQSRHTQLTRKAAGRGGRTEVPIAGGRRLDIKKPNAAIEIERSADPARIRAALQRLTTQTNIRKELRVPQPNLDRAAEIARGAGIKVTVTNLSGSKRRPVRQ
jgi:hypothetical protein